VTAPALSARGLSCDYGDGPVLRNVDLDIAPGEVVGIVGPSGCGKSTLLKAFAGTIPARHGGIRVFGEPLTRQTAHRYISFVPQTSAVNPAVPMTAMEAVMLGLAGRSARRPSFSRPERRRANELLDRLGLDGFAGRQVAELSGGQLQRVLIARALITDPAIVLMDEPTSGLDLRRLREVLLLARELHRAGTTIVLSTHDLNWVAVQLPRVVFLDGTVVADGRPSDVVTTELMNDVYGAPAKVIRDRSGNVIVLAQLATPPAERGDRSTHTSASAVEPVPASRR
jgi:ABC-type Mn2+/Zn2+ transport system ATPase subunit